MPTLQNGMQGRKAGEFYTIINSVELGRARPSSSSLDVPTPNVTADEHGEANMTYVHVPSPGT